MLCHDLEKVRPHLVALGTNGGLNILHYTYIIICDIYIAPFSARSCSRALYGIIYNIIMPNSDRFPSSTYLNSQRSIQRMLPL